MKNKVKSSKNLVFEAVCPLCGYKPSKDKPLSIKYSALEYDRLICVCPQCNFLWTYGEDYVMKKPTEISRCIGAIGILIDIAKNAVSAKPELTGQQRKRIEEQVIVASAVLDDLEKLQSETPPPIYGIDPKKLRGIRDKLQAWYPAHPGDHEKQESLVTDILPKLITIIDGAVEHPPPAGIDVAKVREVKVICNEMFDASLYKMCQSETRNSIDRWAGEISKFILNLPTLLDGAGEREPTVPVRVAEKMVKEISGLDFVGVSRRRAISDIADDALAPYRKPAPTEKAEAESEKVIRGLKEQHKRREANHRVRVVMLLGDCDEDEPDTSRTPTIEERVEWWLKKAWPKNNSAYALACCIIGEQNDKVRAYHDEREKESDE